MPRCGLESRVRTGGKIEKSLNSLHAARVLLTAKHNAIGVAAIQEAGCAYSSWAVASMGVLCAGTFVSS